MSENMEKNKQHSICRRVSGLWPPVEHRPVRGGHRAAHPEGEVAAASAYLRFRGADFDSASCSAAVSSVRVYYSGPSRRRLWNARTAKRET